VVIVVCVIAHFSRVASNGYEEMVALLRKRIALEGKDKAFLLKLLQEASSNQPIEALPGGGGGEPVVTPASGKQFAKYTVPHVEHVASNTPPSRRRGKGPSLPGSSSSARLDTSSMSSHHNPSYLQHSHDLSAEHFPIAASPSTTTSPDNENPVYDDRSPGRRPDLPFPSQYVISPGDARL